MDAASLIVAALTAGITEATKGTITDAVKGAYDKLKLFLQNKFQEKPGTDMILAKAEENPEIWEAPLKAMILEVGADHSSEILSLAQELLSLVNPEQAATETYNTQISGDVKGFVQGSNANVTMNFGDE